MADYAEEPAARYDGESHFSAAVNYQQTDMIFR